MNYEPNTTTYPHLVCERKLAEIDADREMQLATLADQLAQGKIDEENYARCVKQVERKAKMLTTDALTRDYTNATPLFDAWMSRADVRRVAVEMANAIDRETRISDETHARLHAVLKAEVAAHARANAGGKR